MNSEANVFSIRLKELRTQQGISQYRLAEKLGLSRSMISNYEQGIREPDYKTIILLAQYFSVSTDYLLGVTGVKNQFLTSDEMEHFSQLLKQIDDIRKFDINQIADLLEISANYGELIEKLKSLSNISISELDNYIDLLKIRDSVENEKRTTSSALEKESS